VLLGALVLHEPITVGLVLGFPLVIVGSVLGTWGRAAPPPDASVCDAETGEAVLDTETPRR
jgi:drug/metabolite transporter (DMT)-like permease